MDYRKARLSVEQLESRLNPAPSVVLNSAGVLLIQADDGGDTIAVSQPTPASVLVGTGAGKTQSFDATQVKLVFFIGGKGGDYFANQTAIPSQQLARNRAGTRTVLIGGTGNDTLTGSGNFGAESYLSDPAGTNVLKGGQGFNNIFGGSGADTISAGPADNLVYDILGTNTIDGANGTGTLLVNAASSVSPSPNEQVVTFFQPTFTGQTSPFFVQADANGNRILYLLPQSTGSVTFDLEPAQPGFFLAIYRDATTSQAQLFQTNTIAWAAFFGNGAGNQVYNGTSVNDVFYGGAGADVIFGGTGKNVLKGHSNSDIVVGRGYYNDLQAGKGATTYLVGAPAAAVNVFRNNTAALNTSDLNVRPGDVLIGTPATINGKPVSKAGNAVASLDDFFAALALVKKSNSNGDTQ